MPVPSYERLLFKKSPLRLAIGQVRFPLLFRFKETPFLARFQGAIERDYPRVSQEQQVGVKLSARGPETVSETLWRFADREGQWSAILGETALTLECRRYSDIDEFQHRFNRLLNAAVEYLGIQLRSRLGLRFVNELRAADADALPRWATLLNPDFVGYAAREFIKGEVEQAFHDIRYKRDDGTLVVRHGLLTGTMVEARPGETPVEQGRFYLIDFDYYDDTEIDLDPGATTRQLRAYNEIIYQFFRWALDGGTLYQQLEPTREGT